MDPDEDDDDGVWEEVDVWEVVLDLFPDDYDLIVPPGFEGDVHGP